ncbi:transposase [Paracoccus pantotrophus]|nr:transposase [Paracoccus pantotrophus]
MVADGGDGFVGRVEVVRRTRGYRRWPEAVKARIVAESFQPGVRVVDVAQRHDLAPHQLSDWRRQARQGLLALPADAMEAVGATVVPAFVPVSVDDEVDASPDAARGAEAAAVLKRTNSFRDKFERYISKDRHNAHPSVPKNGAHHQTVGSNNLGLHGYA